MGENPENKNKMRVYLRVKVAQVRLLSQKLHKEAQKIALAVVIAEFIAVGSWYLAEKQGILGFLQPKMVIIEVAKPAEAKETGLKQPKNARIEAIADKIWLLESSKGVNNYSKCKAQGKINGIGYGIYDNHWICFDSHEEEMRVLRNWIRDKEQQGMSENELLCYYNTGAKQEDCEYAQKAKMLN